MEPVDASMPTRMFERACDILEEVIAATDDARPP